MSNEFIAKNGFISNLNVTIKNISGDFGEFLTVTNSGLITGSGFNSEYFTPTSTTKNLSGQLVTLTYSASGNAYDQAKNNLQPQIDFINNNINYLSSITGGLSTVTLVASTSAALLAIDYKQDAAMSGALFTYSNSTSSNSYQQSVSYTNIVSGNNTTFTSNVSSALQTQITTLNLSASNLQLTFNKMLEPTGFETRTNSNLNWDDSTKTFSISGNYYIWAAGNRYYKTGESLKINDIIGNHFFYYDENGVFTYSNTPWNLTTPHVPIAYVYWDGKVGILLEERHGINMDSSTHYYLHTTRGTQYNTGLAIGDYTPTTSTSAALTYSISPGIIADEDIISNINGEMVGGPYTVLTRIGSAGTWSVSAGNTIPFLYANDNITYNNFNGTEWVQTQSTLNPRYLNYYICVTSAISAQYQIFMIPGQAEYTTLALAQSETFNSLNLGSLSFQEIITLYQINYRRTNFNSGPGRVDIQSVSKIINNNISNSIANVSQHNNLSGVQGGIAGEYYHLTGTEYSNYIGSPTVVNISAFLNSLTYNTSANAYQQSINYTNGVSGNLQQQISQIIQEGTTITSSGGSIFVSQNATQFNVEVSNSYSSNYTTLATTNIVSGHLYSLVDSTSAALINYDILQDAAMSGVLVSLTYDSSANAYIQTMNNLQPKIADINNNIIYLASVTGGFATSVLVANTSAINNIISYDSSANALIQANNYTLSVSGNLIQYINTSAETSIFVTTASANAYQQSINYTNEVSGNLILYINSNSGSTPTSFVYEASANAYQQSINELQPQIINISGAFDKTLTYDITTGSLSAVSTIKGTKFMNYDINGKLISISGSGIYSNKIFIYDDVANLIQVLIV